MSGRVTINNRGKRRRLHGFVLPEGESVMSPVEFKLLQTRCSAKELAELVGAKAPAKEAEAEADKSTAADRWTAEALDRMPFKDLQKLADGHGIKGRSKADLIASLTDKER